MNTTVKNLLSFGVGAAATALLISLAVGNALGQCPGPNSDTIQYDVVNDGTRVRSPGGSLADSQNTSFADDGDRGAYYAGNTIDGNTNNVTADYFFDTSPSGSLTYRFPEARVINRIVLNDNLIASHVHTQNYNVQYSTDTQDGIGGTWNTVPAPLATGTISGNQTIDIPFTTPIATTYIRIVLNLSTANRITMNEVLFFGGDNLGDACDDCPTEPGNLPNGCPEFDSDNDGVTDALDNCPLTANATQTNSDGDSHGDACDNCPTTDNEDQANGDEFQYDLSTDGTRISSSVGSLNDFFDTRFTDAINDPRHSGSYWPGNVIDGDTDGVDQADTANYWLRQANSGFLTLEFPDTRVICKVVLDNDTRTAHWNTQRYEVQSSLDTTDGVDGTWSTVSAPNAIGIMNGDDVVEVVLDQPIAVHHIRVALTRLSGTRLSMNEITVFGCDHLGDACDDCPAEAGDLAAGCAAPPDYDNDGIPDSSDNCPFVANADQTNSDGDSLGDACDNCPTDDNESQANSDVVQYNFAADGTLMASSVGSFFEDGDTSFKDASNGNIGSYYVGNLMDGNLAGLTPDYWMSLSAVPSATLVVKFPAVQNVFEVVLTDRTVTSHWNTKSYVVQYSTDTTTGFDGTWQDVPSPDAAGISFWDGSTVVTLDTPILTQYIRVTLVKIDGQGVRTQLNEIEVLAGDPVADACDACPLLAAVSPSGCDCAGDCADLEAAVLNQICDELAANPPTSLGTISALVDETLDNLLAGGEPCDSTAEDCLATILANLGL